MFNFGNNVDHGTVDEVERAGDSRLSTNWRQISDKVDSRLCRRFVAGFGDCRLCRQCVPCLTVVKRLPPLHRRNKTFSDSTYAQNLSTQILNVHFFQYMAFKLSGLWSRPTVHKQNGHRQ